MRKTYGTSLPRGRDDDLGDRRDGDLPDWERYYFSAGGTNASEAERQTDLKALENGEKPWQT